jgi:hypothetical protein
MSVSSLLAASENSKGKTVLNKGKTWPERGERE